MCPYCLCASALFVPEICCVNPEIMLKSGEMVEKAARAMGRPSMAGRVEAQSLWTMRGVVEKSITSCLFFHLPLFPRAPKVVCGD